MNVYVVHEGKSIEKSKVLGICTSLKSAVFLCAKYAVDTHQQLMDWEIDKLEYERRIDNFFIISRETDSCFY
jgi:hypothetical protein